MKEVYRHYILLGISILASFAVAYIIVSKLSSLVLFIAWIVLTVTLTEMFATLDEEFLKTAVGKIAALLALAEPEAFIVVLIIFGVIAGIISAYIVLNLVQLVKAIAFALITVNVFVRLMKWLDPKGFELMKEALFR